MVDSITGGRLNFLEMSLCLTTLPWQGAGCMHSIELVPASTAATQLYMLLGPAQSIRPLSLLVNIKYRIIMIMVGEYIFVDRWHQDTTRKMTPGRCYCVRVSCCYSFIDGETIDWRTALCTRQAMETWRAWMDCMNGGHKSPWTPDTLVQILPLAQHVKLVVEALEHAQLDYVSFDCP